MQLSELAAIFSSYGADPGFVDAAGASISCKCDGSIYVKGSGFPPAEIDEDGFVELEREKLSAILRKTYPDDPAEAELAAQDDILDARHGGECHERPGAEALLHNLFPQKFVLRAHPAVLNGIACARGGEAAVNRLFPGKALWIGGTRPGYPLARAAGRAFAEHGGPHGKAPGIVFARNHGVFFAAETIEGMDGLVSEAMGKARGAVGREPDFGEIAFDEARAVAVAPAVRMLSRSGGTCIATFRTNAEIRRLAASEEAFAPVASPYTPSHIVHCAHEPLFVKSRNGMEEQYKEIEAGFGEYTRKHGCKPKIVAIQGLGFFGCGKDKREADIAAELFLDAVRISVYAESFGGGRCMDPGDIAFLRGREAGGCRKEAGPGGDGAKRAAGKIALVTGGAQGFGRGIAERLAAEGANVVVADLNEAGAAEAADRLCGEHGKGTACAARADVSNEESVQAMVDCAVLEYGGLDILVNNAGINKPGGLEEMDVETFERINRINYTAYFLGVKYASRPMKVQHRFHPGWFMDIIQINSKSGIAGSNKNFAYAGSKFAGIGLTQSFALELASHNIKVNSVCPGNFFEGPLWADPQNGMLVQYLKSGKVPGAKTVEDVKRAYEEKVPMGRGCRVCDVAAAVLYLIEQEYETGQALPVTGGQLMLK